MLVIAIHPASTFHPRLLPINYQSSRTSGLAVRISRFVPSPQLSTINHQPSTVPEPTNWQTVN